MNIEEATYNNIFNNNAQYRFNLKSKYDLTIEYKKNGKNCYFQNSLFDNLNSLIGFGLNLTVDSNLSNDYSETGTDKSIKIKFNIPCVGYGNNMLPESFLSKKTGLDASDGNTNKDSYHIDKNVRINGDLYVGDDITAFATYSLSDVNLKKDIVNLDNCLNVVEKLNPVGFKWKKNDGDEVGFIAQEIAELIPEIVEDINGHKVISETKIIAYLVGAIQELDKELKELERLHIT